MVETKKGSPENIGECYVDVIGKILAESMVLWLINEKIFFVIDPISDDMWRVYTKMEFRAGLRTMVNTLKKEIIKNIIR
jgi:hypothetical protein